MGEEASTLTAWLTTSLASDVAVVFIVLLVTLPLLFWFATRRA